VAVATPRRPDDSAAAVCSTCGSSLNPGQEYCLECGTRLTPEPATREALTAWRPASPWYAGDWVWPALASLVVAIVVVTAVVAYAQEDGEATTALTLTGPQATAPTETAPEETLPVAPATPTSTLTTPGQTTAAPTTTPTTPPAPSAIPDWPAGQDGYTVVLASLPKTAGRDAAIIRAKEAKRRGIRDVGVLDADGFASFHPGYYVVFSGVHESQGDAERAAGEAHDNGFADAYPKVVTR
jgi:hypothetical protein